jgi:hypothetical protein
MSGLAGLLAGHSPAGIYRWHGAFDVADVRHAVEHAGKRFGHVDGWTAQSKAEFLAAVGEALDLPDYYGQNFDALEECLRSVGRDTGAVLLWDGWSTLARTDARAFGIAMDILGSRAAAGSFSVLLRGDGPDEDLAEVASLD